MRDLGPTAYTKWLVAFWVPSAVAIVGLVSTTSHPEKHPGLFAFSVSWVIIVVVAAITRDPLLKVDPKRFRFAHWEHEGRVYERFGVAALGWLLVHTPLGWLNPRVRPASHRPGIDGLLREINYAEGAHLVGGVVTLGLAVRYAVAGSMAVGASFAVIGILSHVYPVMLQRRNRGRVLRLVRRLGVRSVSAQPSSTGLAGDLIGRGPMKAEPCAAPNGGPATGLGQAGVPVRPPK